MKERILRAADDLRGDILAISRDLHDHPELSLEEHRSSALLVKTLAEGGFEVVSGVAGLPTAFVARLRGAGSRPRVAILAEYDALPGIGHGCAHNLIAAAGVGAGLTLARAAAGQGGGPDLPGEILVIGTPAEETVGGKVILAENGVFDGLDAAMMVHAGSEWRAFADSLACASLQVTYLGRESHAAAWPEKGINALDALILLFVSLDMMKKRLGREVVIPGVILEGGVRPNIVPARAVGAFSLRAATAARRDEVRAEFEKAARAIGEASGCGVEIRQTDRPYDEMATNRALAGRFAEHLAMMGVRIVDGPRQNKGSLDMGNVSRLVPSIHPFVAIADADIPSHSAGFAAASISTRGEEALMTAVKALALTALDVLRDPVLLRSAREEFESEIDRRRPS